MVHRQKLVLLLCRPLVVGYFESLVGSQSGCTCNRSSLDASSVHRTGQSLLNDFSVCDRELYAHHRISFYFYDYFFLPPSVSFDVTSQPDGSASQFSIKFILFLPHLLLQYYAPCAPVFRQLPRCLPRYFSELSARLLGPKHFQVELKKLPSWLSF